MKIAIVGSRSLSNISLEEYLPVNVTEIVSGGAVGVDLCAMQYAKEKGLMVNRSNRLHGKVMKIINIL